VWKTGATQFTLDCKVQIGDGSTNTWFATELEQAVFTLGLLRSLFANGGYYATKAHLRIGKLDGNGEPCNGSTLFFDNTASNYVAVFDVYNCDVEMYDSQIYIEGMGFVQWLQSAIGVLDGSMNVKRSRMQSDTPTHGQLVVKIADAQIDGLELYNMCFVPSVEPDYSWNDIHLLGTINVIFHPHYGQPITVANLKISDAASHTLNIYGNAQCEVTDVNMDWATITFEAPSGTEWWKFYFSFNRTILDSKGTSYAGKAWTLKRADGVTVASGTTQSNGKLSATDLEVLYRYYDVATGASGIGYGPFKLTVQGDGQHQDLVLKSLPMDKKDVTGVETMSATVLGVVHQAITKRDEPIPLLQIIKDHYIKRIEVKQR